MHMTIT